MNEAQARFFVHLMDYLGQQVSLMEERIGEGETNLYPLENINIFHFPTPYTSTVVCCINCSASSVGCQPSYVS